MICSSPGGRKDLPEGKARFHEAIGHGEDEPEEGGDQVAMAGSAQHDAFRDLILFKAFPLSLDPPSTLIGPTIRRAPLIGARNRGLRELRGSCKHSARYRRPPRCRVLVPALRGFPHRLR